MPYLYALLGFGNANANTACVGPGNSTEGDLLHPLMWWTLFRDMDRLGVHLISGEIPQYRIEVSDPDVLALLTGDRTVSVRVDNVPYGANTGVGITSLSFLLD